MDERPTVPAPDLTWRLSPASVAPAASVDSTLNLRLNAASVIGLLLGYYAMHNQWIQVGWVGLFTLAVAAFGGGQGLMQGWKSDRWLRFAAALILFLALRSSLIHSPGMTVQAFWQGWLGVCLLLLCHAQLWLVGRDPRSSAWLGMAVTLGASLTATGSVLILYGLGSEAMFGARLENWFVYGGWNTVCTGMTFGFAAVWAGWNWSREQTRSRRLTWQLVHVLLVFSTLFTMSRGALLALSLAHAAWLLPQGWRAGWKPAAVLLACVLAFQFSAPLITRLATRQVAAKMEVAESVVTPEMLSDSVIPPNPAARVITRADNGRFTIYKAALQSLTTWQDWLIGKGLWSANDAWSCSLGWYPEHLHSIFVDALVRGGITGLGALLFTLTWGLRRAWKLAVEGESLWFLLAVFGLGGVLLDGDSAFSLLSIPRFETLLLWVPLVIASARLQASSEHHSGPPRTLAHPIN
jgi:hypothetical protein